MVDHCCMGNSLHTAYLCGFQSAKWIVLSDEFVVASRIVGMNNNDYI